MTVASAPASRSAATIRRASAGIKNVSSWPGPVWEKARTRIVSRPVPSHACNATYDAATLLAPYGVIGRSGVSSRKGRSAGSTRPYSSALPTTRTRCTPAARAPSRTCCVPSTFTRKLPVGSRQDAATSDLAARWYSTSGRWRRQHRLDDLAIGDVEPGPFVPRIDHLVAGRSQVRAQVRTDETARTGDERLHARGASRHDGAVVRVEMAGDAPVPGELRRALRPVLAQSCGQRRCRPGSAPKRAPSAPSSCGGTRSAASPTISSIAEPRVDTSGAPHASASSAGRPKPSSNEGYTTAVARRNNATSASSGR